MKLSTTDVPMIVCRISTAYTRRPVPEQLSTWLCGRAAGKELDEASPKPGGLQLTAQPGPVSAAMGHHGQTTP